MRFIVLMLLALSALATQGAEEPLALPRGTPEAEGISSSAIHHFVLEAEDKIDALHSFMLVRHGKVIAEGWWSPYAAEEPHQLNSLIKPFLSTAVGLAVAEGHLKIEDSVLSLFPDQSPANPSAKLQSMRVRDLLIGGTGHSENDIAAFFSSAPRPPGENFVRAFLAMPVTFQPGTHFAYNPPASLMLSAVVEKAAGQTLRDYLQPRLLDVLGMQGQVWNMASHPVAVRTEDLAKLGLLYLQKGMWQGKRVLPAAWVEAATAAQISTKSWVQANMPKAWPDWEKGYGYQFWPTGDGFFRGDGAGGQYMIVMPKHDAVIAITGGLTEMQAVMNLIWDELVPAFAPAPLPADATSARRLATKLAHLSLRTPVGARNSPSVKLPSKDYVFAKNEDGIESLAMQTAGSSGAVALAIRVGGVEQRIVPGYGAWQRGELTTGGESRPFAASGAWTADDVYAFNICLYRTVFCGAYHLRFAGNRVYVNRQSDVLNARGFVPMKATKPQLIGEAQ